MTRDGPPSASFDGPLADWFAAQGWKPAAFQRTVWRRWLRAESGLLVTPTGSGKTLAAYGGVLLAALREAERQSRRSDASHGDGRKTTRQRNGGGAPIARLLWITPLRALAADTARALQAPLTALGLPWTVAMRTGDAGSRDRRLVRQGRAEVVVITPESLALLLSYPETAAQMAGLRGIVVDEWHELLGNKRGVLLQLNLARLRALASPFPIWGLSATLGNLEQAKEVLLPHCPAASIVRTARTRPIRLRSLLPAPGQRFPWAGHLGLSNLGAVLEAVNRVRSALIFTNTRAQAELWHRAMASVWMKPPGTLALHHGSLDAELRAAAEQGLRDGSVQCVVATSSLDLGVDFPDVELVVQVGSPKGMARLMQRAGRSRHRPGEPGSILCVPTHALELAEYAAARRALADGHIESRRPPRLSLDVLAQHCVSLATAGGFDPETLKSEVRGTHAFALLEDRHWQAVLEFIVRGGSALERYPDFHRVVRDQDGHYRVRDRRVLARHRLSIGTITSDGVVEVRYLRGGSLGSIEERFVGRLRRGDRFQFAGRLLEFVRLEDMTAYVRAAAKSKGTVATPSWQGGRMPLSSELGAEVEAVLCAERDSPEMRALAPLLDLQQKVSALPGPQTLLAEVARTRTGWHLSLFPFAGRLVHEGMAAVLALRFGRTFPNTFNWSVNDYGFMLSAQQAFVVDGDRVAAVLHDGNLSEDLRESLNLTELARRQFRDIARVAGLLMPSLPGRPARSLRHLQASSGLLFDVLLRHDPGHVLLAQAQREVLELQLEMHELSAALERCRSKRLDLRSTPTLTPLSFPLWAEAARGQLSTESWTARVRRAAQSLERRHG